MTSHELTLSTYQKQLKDNVKNIYDNYTDLLKTKTEHVNFEVHVKSAEIVRSYQSLIQLVAEIRSYLIINDPSSNDSNNQSHQPNVNDEKLVRLRDEISMFLYELEIPLP